jgi:hypothetical protein
MVVLAVAADGADDAFTVTVVAPEIQVLSVALLTKILCEPEVIPAKVAEA